MELFLKGLFIGVIVSTPIGPLGILTIQRIINNDWKVGFFSGLGAAASDVVYSLCAVFGISFIGGVLHKHRVLIDEAIGVLFLIIGINIFTNALKNRVEVESKNGFALHPGFSNFLLGLSNPTTFLIFITIFTKMGIKIHRMNIGENLMFVLSIFLGSMIFWVVIGKLIHKYKMSFKIETFCLIDKIFGGAIALLGLYSVIKGLLMF